MDMDWLILNGSDERAQQDKWKKEFSDPVKAVTHRLYKMRDIFSRTDRVIRSKSGNADFDCMLMALARVLQSGEFELDTPYIQAATKAVKQRQKTDLGYYEGHYTYFHVKTDGWKGDLTLHFPLMYVHDDMLDDFLELRGSANILRAYHWLKHYNHDNLENVFIPVLFEQYDQSMRDFRLMQDTRGNVSIAEHFIVTLYHAVQDEIFAEDPIHARQIIENTVRYVDSVKKVVKEAKSLKPEKSEALGKFWLNRYFSALLYNTPAYKFINQKETVDGKETSIADAMENYGITYKVSAQKLEEFCTQRKLGFGKKGFTDAAKLTDYLSRGIESGDMEENYAFYGLKALVDILKGKAAGADGQIELTGYDAFMCDMILEAGIEYDLSHTWAGRLTKIDFMPSYYEGRGTDLSEPLRKANDMLQDKMGNPSVPVQVDAAVLASRYFEIFGNVPFLFSGQADVRAEDMVEYLKKQPDAQMRDYFMPKLEFIQERAKFHRSANTSFVEHAFAGDAMIIVIG